MDLNADITMLMLGMFGGGLSGKDEFGKEKDKRTCLLLDKVMEHLPIPLTESRLLNLPSELLADIADLLDSASLAALAQVNTVCQQIARSCQFAEVTFDYSDNSRSLLLQLGQETRARLNGLSKTPFIGACVRRVVVQSTTYQVALRHFRVYESIFGDGKDSCTRDEKLMLQDMANRTYLQYRQDLLSAFSAAMPHLESVSWHDNFAVGPGFFKALFSSSIKHLKLERLPIYEPYLLQSPLITSPVPLQSLYLRVSIAITKNSTEEETRNTSPFVASLLKLCAPTLRKLTWYGDITSRIPHSLGPDPIVFQCLRSLRLTWINLTEESLSTLLRAPLRELSLKYCQWKEIGNPMALWQLPHLETVETPNLLTRDVSSNGKALINNYKTFLEKNAQLRKLKLGEIDTNTLDDHILPILQGNKFTKLTSLSISWEGPGMEVETEPNTFVIPEKSFAVIGTITSLKQLCLTGGTTLGYRNQWVIDHDVLQKHFKNLKKLKTLALCRDTYGDVEDPDTEAYYSDRIVFNGDEELLATWENLDHQIKFKEATEDEEGDTDDNKIWELAHRNYMLDIVWNYATAIPSLRFVYVGQWPIRVNFETQDIMPLSDSRDSCSTMLDRMFGMGEDGDD